MHNSLDPPFNFKLKQNRLPNHVLCCEQCQLLGNSFWCTAVRWETPWTKTRFSSEYQHENLLQLTFFLSRIDPFPRTIILHPVSCSSCFAVMPLGPNILPTKLNWKERKGKCWVLLGEAVEEKAQKKNNFQVHNNSWPRQSNRSSSRRGKSCID